MVSVVSVLAAADVLVLCVASLVPLVVVVVLFSFAARALADLVVFASVVLASALVLVMVFFSAC